MKNREHFENIRTRTVLVAQIQVLVPAGIFYGRHYYGSTGTSTGTCSIFWTTTGPVVQYTFLKKAGICEIYGTGT